MNIISKTVKNFPKRDNKRVLSSHLCHASQLIRSLQRTSRSRVARWSAQPGMTKSSRHMVGAACMVLLASMYAPPASSLVPTAGVHPDQLDLFAGPEFQCKDGSGKIGISQVNDNFCDCSDGRCGSMHCYSVCWEIGAARPAPLQPVCFVALAIAHHEAG